MHLDSHRDKNSVLVVDRPESAPVNLPPLETQAVQMSCPASRCRLSKTFITEDGTEMQTWHSVRRENVRNMRRMVKRVVLYMALIEALRVGPDTIVFAGTRGYPERGTSDYGIAYWAAYILSYVYLCIFIIVWKPLFSWWAPKNSSKTQKTADSIASNLNQVNMILLPVFIGLSLLEYVFWAASAFIYVDAQPVNSLRLPKNTQKNWLARLMLLVGVLISTTVGYTMFQTLEEYGLARVKCMEYSLIVLPIQINLGVLLGSAMQWRMEKRIERKEMTVKAIEIGTVDEKEGLLQV